MKLKADLPDADPTQNVTVVLFGNGQLDDAASDANNATPSATAKIL